MTAEDKKHVSILRGLGVSPGIVIGTAYLLERGAPEPVYYCHLKPSETDAEIERFKNALKESRDQLKAIKKKVEAADVRGMEHVRIIDAHLMILKDNMLINDTVKVIREERVNAEWALKKVLKDLMRFFGTIDDEYLRSRSFDIEHIVNRVIVNLMGKGHESVADLDRPSVVIAHDITPADTAQMVKGTVLAFLTDVGGTTSHTAIMARSLEIPAIVGLETITSSIKTGDIVIIDGTTGTVIVNPSENVTDVYKKRQERYRVYGRELLHYKDLPAETKDGRRIRIMGNIELAEETSSILEHGGEGVGLYRTEYLYMNRRELPTEEEHFNAYKHVAMGISPHPAIIRTLDVGGDKLLMGNGNGNDEINPALGLRAIRFCLKNTDIFKTQLRGILRASAFGKVKILLPMISGIDELRLSKAILEEAKAELKAEGRAFDRDIEIGAMIEIPSAAIIADLICKEVDFISIGTNDLLQYTLAIDRVNEHVAYLYQPLHPAVLRIIKFVADAAQAAGVSVGVCGEMAGEPDYALILIGLGIDQLSMNALSILKVKRLVRSTNYAETRDICAGIVNLSMPKDVEQYINARLPDLHKKEEFWS